MPFPAPPIYARLSPPRAAEDRWERWVCLAPLATVAALGLIAAVVLRVPQVDPGAVLIAVVLVGVAIVGWTCWEAWRYLRALWRHTRGGSGRGPGRRLSA